MLVARWRSAHEAHISSNKFLKYYIRTVHKHVFLINPSVGFPSKPASFAYHSPLTLCLTTAVSPRPGLRKKCSAGWMRPERTGWATGRSFNMFPRTGGSSQPSPTLGQRLLNRCKVGKDGWVKSSGRGTPAHPLVHHRVTIDNLRSRIGQHAITKEPH